MIFGPSPASIRRVLSLCWGLPPGNRTAQAMSGDEPVPPAPEPMLPRVEARDLSSLMRR